MIIIDGYQNEMDFINYLNNRKFKELNIMMQEFIRTLYPKIKNDDYIDAYKYGRYAKADIIVSVRGKKKGISIKYGSRNSVHLERIDKFIFYLKKNRFKEYDKLLCYLYSDGTNNNTGKFRISSADYRITHEDDINIINNCLYKIKMKLIFRFLIQADIKYKIPVDAFIYGYVSDFLWVTSNEVFNYFKNNDISSNGVHVGSLFIQNWNKNLIRNPKYEYCRDYIQVKWYSMFDDIIKIMCNRK